MQSGKPVSSLVAAGHQVYGGIAVERGAEWCTPDAQHQEKSVVGKESQRLRHPISSRFIKFILPEGLVDFVTVKAQVIVVQLAKHHDLWIENVSNGQAS